MGYTPGQLDAVSRYLGLPGGYSAAGIPPAAVQPAAVTMPSSRMRPRSSSTRRVRAGAAELLAQALLLVGRQRIESRSGLSDPLTLALRQSPPCGVVGAALALLLGIELGERSGRRTCGGRGRR